MPVKKGQKIHSKEWKEYLSKKMMGNNYALGLVHTKETRELLSNLHKGGNKGSFKPGPRPELRKRVNKICVTCGVEFEIKLCHSSLRNCSRKCGMKDRAKRQIGRKIHSIESKKRISERNSRGGVTLIHKAIRSSNEYKTWRESVYKRDNYTCHDCGQVGGKLNADHDLPFSLFPDLRLEVLNGQTLCVKCHRKKPRILKHLLEIHMMS